MKTMRLKKLLFVLVAMFVSTTAWAEDLVAWHDYSKDGVKHFRWFVYSDGRLELSAGADMGDGEIPALSDTPFLDYKSQISKLVVNNGIKNLPKNLFLDIPLVTVDLTGASHLTDITGAFYGNKELETVYLGDKITAIGANTFDGCTSLKSFTGGFSGPTSIGNQAFNGCTSMEDFIGLSGLTTIGTYAFKGCTSLKYIDLRATSLAGPMNHNSCGNSPDQTIVYLPAECTVNEYNMVAGETCPELRLYESSDYKGVKSFTANKVTYERTMAAGKFYTICLPYVYKNAAWKYYQIDKVADNTITFKEIDQESLTAGQPYLVSTGTAGVSNLNTTVATDIDGGSGETVSGDFQFYGTYSELSNQYLIDYSPKSVYILQTDKSWKKVTTTDATAYVPPFRAFILTDKAVGARSLDMDIDGNTTGIQQLKTIDLDGTGQWFDLSGRRLSQPKKGINIVNGRKVIIK